LFKVKKRINFLNIIKFNLLILGKKNNFIALGGINSKNLNKLRLLNISGFAGISFFQKKTAP
jgi:thiamine-phosphate pyrophosphorylase